MPTIVSTISSTTTITDDSDSSDISIQDLNASPSIPSPPSTSAITLDNDKKINDDDSKSSSSLSLYTAKDIKNDRDFLLHYIFKYFINGNFTSPIDSPTMKNCLDIGFGSGIWMMETATEFPNCRCHGIDTKPRTPDLIYPQNCSFIKGDFLEGLPYANETFDLVNVRLIVNTLTLNQLDFLLGEISRVLKPKGYVEFLEQDLSIFDNCGIETLKAIKILNKNNYSQPIKTMLHDLLNKHGKFSHSEDLKIHVPMGKWAGMVGELYLEAFGLSLSNHPSFTSPSLSSDNNEGKVIQSKGFEKLFKTVSLECDRYKTNFTYYIGSAKKN